MNLLNLLWLAQASLPAAPAEFFALNPETAALWRVERLHDSEWQLRLEHRPKQDGPRILIIYSKSSPAYDTALNIILARFAARRDRASFNLIHQGLSPGRAASRLRASWSLIVAMGSDATAALHADPPPGKTPIVTVCAKDPVLLRWAKHYDVGASERFAFTSLDIPIEVQLGYLRQLVPELRHLGILFDRENQSAVATQVLPLERLAREQGVHVHQVAVTGATEARAQLTGAMARVSQRILRDDPKAAHSVYWISGSSALFGELATIGRQAGRIPVLSVTPSLVCEDRWSAVLSIGVSFESNANLACATMFRLLQGSTPASLPVGLVTPPDISINLQVARAIGLKIPFSMFERAMFVYAPDGRLVRAHGNNLTSGAP